MIDERFFTALDQLTRQAEQDFVDYLRERYPHARGGEQRPIPKLRLAEGPDGGASALNVGAGASPDGFTDDRPHFEPVQPAEKHAGA